MPRLDTALIRSLPVKLLDIMDTDQSICQTIRSLGTRGVACQQADRPPASAAADLRQAEQGALDGFGGEIGLAEHVVHREAGEIGVEVGGERLGLSVAE